MELYCLEDFKVEFEKLKSKNSYKTIEREIIDYFIKKSPEELLSGVRLNNSIDTPYIKKRLGGRGGFRVYFLLMIKNNALYLMFVHPKTGSQGSDNITDESKVYLYKKVFNCIQSGDLYKLSLDDSESKIKFDKLGCA
ncbi:MAG: hypothetical protein GX879_07095 [Bacteroidales bacterium]|nr:hypothetical protein [Bacteroidales bacterium]